MRRSLVRWSAVIAVAAAGALASCDRDEPTKPQPERLDPAVATARNRTEPLDPALIAAGREIFRFDTFGDEKFWTDTLRMHEVIQTAVTPAVALSVGLKVDADALPQEVKDALAAGQVDLNSTATTLTLLKLNAVVGIKGDVQRV